MLLLTKESPQPESINGLTPPESEMILNWLMDMVLRNHDLQCRFRWQGPNDMGTLFSIYLSRTKKGPYTDVRYSYLGQPQHGAQRYYGL
jgi:hypothetical protein